MQLGRSTPLTRNQGRWCVVAAAALWSLSGVLAKSIALPGLVMACFRALFAGLALVPLLRRRHIRFRPAMLGMVACFATMNAAYVSAITMTTAANAIMLQYTAPVWMFLASVLWLGEPLERTSLVSLVIAMAGVTMIVVGGWASDAAGISLALVAGLSYGGVAVFLRVLREEDSVWLTVLNHLTAGIVLVPLVAAGGPSNFESLTAGKLVALAVFGVVQMAVPYILFSRGLSAVTTQEAGIITLLEPVLNPVLTYLAVREEPSRSTLVGGAIILVAVAVRYARRDAPPSKHAAELGPPDS